jgi:hypothetical protein
MINLASASLLSLTETAMLIPPARRSCPVTLQCVLRWVLTGDHVGALLHATRFPQESLKCEQIWPLQRTWRGTLFSHRGSEDA